uniref:Uncharacterized protein n=1 Tax=Sipha flava TaxID=143950 RepID=A0A2S2QFG4_9HEMI
MVASPLDLNDNGGETEVDDEAVALPLDLSAIGTSEVRSYDQLFDGIHYVRHEDFGSPTPVFCLFNVRGQCPFLTGHDMLVLCHAHRGRSQMMAAMVRGYPPPYPVDGSGNYVTADGQHRL